MEHSCAEIVKDRPYIEHCVDWKALDRLTDYLPFSDIELIPWDQVETLHIFRSDIMYSTTRLKKSRLGYHIGEGGHWVLILGDGTESTENTVARCGKNLQVLNIMSDTNQPIDLTPFCNLQSLRYIRHPHAKISDISGLQGLRKLKKLALRNVDFGRNLDVSHMPELVHLELYLNGINTTGTVVTGIETLFHLDVLSLFGISWGPCLNLSQLSNLNQLQLFDGKETTAERDRFIGLSNLTNLEFLNLPRNQIGSIIDISSLKKLKYLHFPYCSKLRQISGLSYSRDLEVLNLIGCGLKTLPDEIKYLPNMKELDLSRMELDELPEWLPDLGLEFSLAYRSKGIALQDTKIRDVDMSIFEQPRDVILQWFDERKKGSSVPLNEVKVVFLGDGEAGKTHTIARLLEDGKKPTADQVDGKATPGIVIRDKDYTMDGKKIQVHFWDFGGQEILHSMHRMFLTERTLYVVIINARDDTQDDRARYWLHNIKSFAGSAPVLLVLNKIDQNPNASIDKPNLQRIYEGLRDVIRMSALEDSPKAFNSTFTDALLKHVRELGTLGTLWPRSWLSLKTGLETMESHYIHGDEYEDLCDSCGVAQNREELLHWFNDLGVSFCYGGSAKLEDYVILKPEWLTNAIYIILFNKCSDAENGVIPHEAIYRMLQKPRKGAAEVRRVLKNVFYRPEEAEYVLDVIRKFRLSYKVKENAEFIPVLCQRESMTVAEEYKNDPDTLEFQMSFEYLPDNVIHRLMVEMRQDLDIQNVWRTGARFFQRGTGLSAVVKSDSDVLRIFVRRDNALHLPNTYLHILKSNIDQIVADMKLQPPFCEVVYKADGITEAFDYDDLIFALQDGETTYRSKDRRRRTRNIPIQDILNQSGRMAEMELDTLRADIITACMQLQSNRKFWDATEDEWNTAIRDALRNMKYLVNDQTFQGISGGEKKAGELDLDIRKDPRIPWTIYEALKIKDKSKGKWNEHLQKLLDNYNPSGLNYLFMVTYVNCDKDHFQDIWSTFQEHIKWFDPGKYERLPSSFSHINLHTHHNPNCIQAVRCTYDRDGFPTTVCHIFARMGR